MRVRIGERRVYTVEILDLVVNADGEEVAGLCDYTNRKILIAAGLDRQQRRTALRHEVYHAYDEAFPGDRDGEQAADFHASVSDELDGQIEQMGGWGVLDLLVAKFYASVAGTPVAEVLLAEAKGPTPDIWAATQVEGCETTALPSSGRAECGMCSTTIADGSIVTSKQTTDVYTGSRIFRRALFCPHCEHVASWSEGIGPDGKPNGAVMGAQEYDTDSVRIDEFLKKYPHTVGLIAN